MSCMNDTSSKYIKISDAGYIYNGKRYKAYQASCPLILLYLRALSF